MPRSSLWDKIGGRMPQAHTRVVLLDLERTMRELIEKTIAAQSDFELVPAVGSTSLAPAVESSGAEVIISGRDDEEFAHSILKRWPRTKLLAVTRGGREALLYRLLPHRQSLGEVSPAQLIDVLRRARDAGWAPPK